jgi:hypothetical protein
MPIRFQDRDSRIRSRTGRGRGRGGIADDETCRDQELALQSGIVSAVDLGVERIEGSAGEVSAGEADGGERGKRVLSECNVVEAYHGEILWYAEALSVGSAQNANGGHVVGADDGGGASGELAQLLKACDASFEGVIAFDDPLFLKLKTGGLHSGAKVVFPGDSGVKAVRAREESDGVVTQRSEVTNGLIHSGGVVEENGAGFGIVEFELR